MKDETKGLELVPVEGQLYSIAKLIHLAGQGASDATASSKNQRTFAVQLEEGSEGSHAFRVSSSSGMPAVYLRVRIEKDNGGVFLTRTLETISEPSPKPWLADVKSESLKPLRLELDASGNPLAYLSDEPLDESAITRSLIDPVREAVGDLPKPESP